MQSIKEGSLARATTRAAGDLAQAWPRGDSPEAAVRSLSSWTESFVLRLERPGEGLSPEATYVLNELSNAPLFAAVIDANGNLLTSAPAEAGHPPSLPARDDAAWERARQTASAVTLPGADSPDRVRRVLAAVSGTDGIRGYLLVELRVPPPWRKQDGDVSYEWPILIGYLLIFGIASAVFLVRWVTRRLNHIADAASAWSRGDFSTLIVDDTSDE